jgi:hypothetical protein
MPERMSPSMRRALRYIYSGKFLLFRPRDVPGGQATIRALLKRGMVERDGSGFVRITPAGISEVER